jgi:hypothetical protein
MNKQQAQLYFTLAAYPLQTDWRMVQTVAF